MTDIAEVADRLGLDDHEWDRHGRDRAKVRPDSPPPDGARPGRYVLVTGITPTQAGEGKTVTSLGLAMALWRGGHRAVATLRMSSLGPTLGSKGGGAGGGRAVLAPLEEALLGLGADQFAVESATNLLAARIDDLLYRPDPALPTLDPASVWWRRVVDVDDRALRVVEVHPDGTATGPARTTGFDITAASEVMAVLSLATDWADLRRRLGAVVIGADRDDRPVTAETLGAAGAMAALLREALAPNLLQTAEGTPVLVHGGPFANIAHGCSSVVADLVALPRADVVITEAGFGADLGAEKFLHLKCAASGRTPDAVVLVATVRALAEHGTRSGATGPTAALVDAGAANLRHHVGVLRAFGLPVVVAVNRFPDDDPAALTVLAEHATAAGAFAVVPHTAFADGGAGATDLAAAVVEACRAGGGCSPLLRGDEPIADKVAVLATRVYGAGEVRWSPAARTTLAWLERHGFGRLPVCVAKTHRSLSHDPALAGAPRGFAFPVEGLRLAAGAGFVTVYAGGILTMPGLPRRPRFLDVDLTAEGSITGLV